jgi:hypothetical protein
MKRLAEWVKIRKIKGRAGECGAIALAIFFETTKRDIMGMLRVLADEPEQGITTQTLNLAMKYGEVIYRRKAEKFLWRGLVSKFVLKYHTGTYLLNCSEHITIVVDGVVQAKNREDHQIYSVFKLI